MQDCDKGNGLILYHNPTSYYSQRVVIMLHEKKLNFSSVLVNPLSMEQYQPWFLELNPKGQVPVLKDGIRVVPDSNRILDYLDDNFSNGDHKRLDPREGALPEVKQSVSHFCQLVDAIPAFYLTFGSLFNDQFITDPAPPLSIPAYRIKMKEGVSRVIDVVREVLDRPNLPEAIQLAMEDKLKYFAGDVDSLSDSEKYATVIDKVASTLDEVENKLLSASDAEQWLCCTEFTVADIYLAVFLNRLRVIGLDTYFWKNGKRPSVEAYYQRVILRDSVHAAIKSHFEAESSPAEVAEESSSDFLYYGIAASAAIGAVIVGLHGLKRLSW